MPGKTLPTIPPEQDANRPTPASAPTAPAPTAPAPRRSRPSGPLEDVSTQRRVRRGQAEIEARIDLHGFTQDAARRALIDFLLRSHAQEARCVLVITGKGRAPDDDGFRGQGRGVLNRRLVEWLEDPGLRPLLAGYAPAHPRHGGSGAFYVMLKRRSAG